MGEIFILPSFPINTQLWALEMMLEWELNRAFHNIGKTLKLI
jgi:hypothetical protein